jgi:cell division protein FtsQ
MMRMLFKAKRTRNRKKAREADARRLGLAAARPGARARAAWRAVARVLAAGGAVVATLCVVFWALNQPIRTVRVTGRFQHVAPQDIERVVARQARGKGLLTIDLAAVSGAIQALPWVDAVSVEREWPHGLAVLVVEQVAAARWGPDGLVNSNGVRFVTGVSRYAADLARLSGPEGSEAEVTQRYLAMRRRLEPAGLTVTALRLDARGAWQLDLSNGIAVRLGRSQVEERFDKFISAALGIVEQRAEDISYVDMRYTNGFAIGWKSGRAGAFQRGHSTCPRSGERPCMEARAGGPDAMDGQWQRAYESQHA